MGLRRCPSHATVPASCHQTCFMVLLSVLQLCTGMHSVCVSRLSSNALVYVGTRRRPRPCCPGAVVKYLLAVSAKPLRLFLACFSGFLSATIAGQCVYVDKHFASSYMKKTRLADSNGTHVSLIIM